MNQNIKTSLVVAAGIILLALIIDHAKREIIAETSLQEPTVALRIDTVIRVDTIYLTNTVYLPKNDKMEYKRKRAPIDFKILNQKQ